MPVVKMQKVAILSHNSHSEDLLEFLQDEGVMEVSPNEETVDIEHPKVSYEKAEVVFAIDFLRPSATKEALKIAKSPGSNDDIRKAALHTDFRAIIDECKKLEDESSEVLSERQKLEAEKERLLPWQKSPLNLNEKETKTSKVTYGTCPPASIDDLRAEIDEKNLKVELVQIEKASNEVFLASVVWKKDTEEFERTSAKHGFTAVDLPEAGGAPVQELGRIDQELKKFEENEMELNRKRTELAKSFPDLVRLGIYLQWIDQKQSVRSEFSATDQTVSLTGWIPSKEFNDLEKKLEQKFPAVALLKTEPREGEEPPMQIKNVDAVAPFEAVTRLYGIPGGGEMDPTRPLMPFFILYFGLCLTDAGYGFILAALMGVLIWKFKLKMQEQKLVWLLFYAGIVTFLVSIPFGGWFGITPDAVPAFLTYTNSNGDLRFVGQIWDLTKDVDFFRNLALTLGSIQILFGIFLAGYWKAIHGKVFEAIASHFTVHLFAIALALKYALGVPFMDYALIAIGLLFIWGQGKGPWFVRPLVGTLGALGFLIGIMSNILSYLRILALGLATGALAFAINQVAVVLKDLLPIFLGIPVFICILLFGHMISLALNGLGSFVHSGRLQFIEFFGQFFQGGGREFTPFKRSLSPIA